MGHGHYGGFISVAESLGYFSVFKISVQAQDNVFLEVV